MILAILLGASLTLTWPTRDCVPEKFTVEVVQPSTRIYTSTLRCGGIVCEETWITYDGKPIGEKSSCPVPAPPRSLSPSFP